ncbi:type II toxin-antitoxin system Phd/YefM family antitoxin [Aliiroseovarius crassostreae]|uniref:type II toxin-antitoxin system Phd/YefM family antitoxin n=1 Tax=Aliiroseovarius crassostreae TaxID=154981 RepID=UPI0035CD01AD
MLSIGRNATLRPLRGQDMKVFSTTQLRHSTSEILEAVQCEPVMITRYGKSRFVMMSREHFDAMQRALNSAT